MECLASELLTSAAAARVNERLDAWLKSYMSKRTKPLLRLGEADLSGPARGLAYQLIERLGSMPRRGASREINALTPKDRAALSRLGVRIGRQAVFLPAMLKPAPRAARALLWAVHSGWDQALPTPTGEALSMALDSTLPSAFYDAIGYRRAGHLALRLDAVERILARAGTLSRSGPFAPTAELAALAGCDVETMGAVLSGLGYHAETPDAQGVVFFSAPSRKRRHRQRRRGTANPCSPFAKLASLRVSP